MAHDPMSTSPFEDLSFFTQSHYASRQIHPSFAFSSHPPSHDHSSPSAGPFPSPPPPSPPPHSPSNVLESSDAPKKSKFLSRLSPSHAKSDRLGVGGILKEATILLANRSKSAPNIHALYRKASLAEEDSGEKKEQTQRRRGSIFQSVVIQKAVDIFSQSSQDDPNFSKALPALPQIPTDSIPPTEPRPPAIEQDYKPTFIDFSPSDRLFGRPETHSTSSGHLSDLNRGDQAFAYFGINMSSLTLQDNPVSTFNTISPERDQVKATDSKSTDAPPILVCAAGDSVTTRKSRRTSEQSKIDSEAQLIAKRCFEGDEGFLRQDQVLKFLSSTKELNSRALTYYMLNFDFAGIRLDDALRRMCERLYIKGETQQIDAILAGFARRYWECNPKSIFESTDEVHAISYSLLLLNTDLHIAQGSDKMTRSQFVCNTMETIQAVQTVSSENREHTAKGLGSRRYQLESMLKDMYTRIKLSQILQPNALKFPDSATTSAAPSPSPSGFRKLKPTLLSDFSGSLVRALNYSQSSPSSSSYRDSLFPTPTSDEDGKMSLDNWPTTLSPSQRRVGSDDTTSLSSASSNLAPISPQLSPSSAPAATPYAKEGILTRKHLYERRDLKARHRDWRECYVVVESGALCMYHPRPAKLQNPPSSVHEKTKAREGHRRDKGVYMGELNLRHSMSKILPSGYSRARPNVFALSLPDGATYLFQAGTAPLVKEWVEACLYWAARESRPPLIGGVCNVEYGWSWFLEDRGEEDGVQEGRDDALPPVPGVIQEWQPPTLPLIASPFSMDETEQSRNLKRHVETLERELEAHSRIRERMERIFAPSHRAMSNWERKSQFLLHELIKYQEYKEALVRRTQVS
ncbi:uncharacterized protein VTP21DRAFT_4515 [Calcarisporiella thermophila]|uniref:uncharacterized protein n=1 Tax=Calcarisporiella thermophila TaxID=911321 RepID=UPI0037433FAA